MNPHSRPAHARPEAAAGQIHFAKREEFFGPLGVTNIRTFVDPEQPTRVGVLMDVPDMGAVMAAIESDDRCPRHESNMRTRFRKPLLYPLSYGGRGTLCR
jgi:hypothetical protein